MGKLIYLDNAATTMVAPAVLEKMLPYFSEQYGNAGTPYAFGRQAAEAIQTARAQVARLLGCAPGNVIFTSGGSEGNNMVFRGIMDSLLAKHKAHLVVSAIEHDSVLRPAEWLIKHGFDLTLVYPNEDGVITRDAVAKAIRDETGLISVMFANNETGVRNEVKEIGALCKERGILFHCDCVQAAGQYELDVVGNNIDFATISAHKIHGPKGVGALYASDLSFEPLIFGGAEQEFGLRGGTENVPGIVGLGEACGLAAEFLQENLICVSSRRQAFMQSLLSNLPFGNMKEAGISINGDKMTSPGKVLNLKVDDVSGEALVLMMDAMGVCISSGSACNSKESNPSHVLLANGLTSDEARSSVRISFSRYNTEDEVVKAGAIMADCIKILRSYGGESIESSEE